MQKVSKKLKNLLFYPLLASALFFTPLNLFSQSNENNFPEKNNKTEWKEFKQDVVLPLKEKNEFVSAPDNITQFYGDIALNPFKQPNYKTHGVFTLYYYGSGSVNGDTLIDWTDYNTILGSTSDRADVDGNGVPGQLADKTMLFQYLTDQIRYLPAHWDLLQNRLERISWLQKAIAIDQTQVYKPGWNCYDYSKQLFINMCGIENIAGSGINFSKYDTTKNARFNIPFYETATQTSSLVAHSINSCAIGDSTGNFNSWYYIEPQNDTRVYPGYPSMGANSFADIKRFAYFWSNFLNQYVYGDLSLVNFDLQNGQVVNTVVPHPEAVINRTLENVVLQGTKPVNTTVNWENGIANLSPSVTGYPTNVSPANTLMLHNDSTDQNPNINSKWHYWFTDWRDWKLQSPENSLVDSTLGSRRGVFWNNGRAPQIITVQDTAKPVAISTPNGLTYLYSQYNPSNIPATQATDNCGVWACVRTITSGQGTNPSQCNYWNFSVAVKDSLYDPSGNFRIVNSTVNVNLDPIQWTYVPPTWESNYWEDWQNPANTGGTATAINPAGPSVNVNVVGDLSYQNPDSTQCSHYNFPYYNYHWATNALPVGCQDSVYALQLVNINEELAPELGEVPGDTVVPVGGCITPQCLGVASGTDTISGVPPTPMSYDSIIYQGDSSVIFDRHHYVVDICGTPSTQGIQNVVQEIMPGIFGYGKGKTFHIFPNPTSNYANIIYNSSKPEKANLRITDLTGRTLEERALNANPGENKYSVDVSNYPAGTYLINYTSLESVKTEKLVKVK